MEYEKLKFKLDQTEYEFKLADHRSRPRIFAEK